MKIISIFFCSLCFMLNIQAQEGHPANMAIYLNPIKKEMKAIFPKNRTLNLVFHGHSVPSGYWANSEVHSLQSYPYLLLKELKSQYPHAVINIILTSIGGENSVNGQKRFTDVLALKPDVVFIDYALNDMGIGLKAAKKAWSKMIEAALAQHIKVMLLTPSPDQRQDIADPYNILAQHATQIRQLAAQYHVGLADPFSDFVAISKQKGSVKPYMSHVNHPNEKGHAIIADALFKWFN